MNKKVARILIIFLILISISTMCYAGFVEVNISKEIPMSFFQRIGILIKYVIGILLEGCLFLNRVHYGFFKIRLDFYIVAGIILLYAILNFLIVRKKKELAKISIKINIIILLILLVISTLNVTNITNIYELIFIILALLITSLVFQKVILKKDDDKTKKYNRILKMIMVVLIIIEIIIYIIAYIVMFHIPMYDFQEILLGVVSPYEYLYGDIDDSEPILVEVLYKYTSPWYPTSYEKYKYTISIGKSIKSISKNEVLNIDDEGVLLEYINYYYKKNEETKDISTYPNNNWYTPYEMDLLTNYEYVSEKTQKKLSWNTWYMWSEPEEPGVMKDGDVDTYIRVIKSK